MNVCGVTFGGYLTKILSFKTGNLLNNSKFHLLSEGTVQGCETEARELLGGMEENSVSPTRGH